MVVELKPIRLADECYAQWSIFPEAASVMRLCWTAYRTCMKYRQRFSNTWKEAETAMTIVQTGLRLGNEIDEMRLPADNAGRIQLWRDRTVGLLLHALVLVTMMALTGTVQHAGGIADLILVGGNFRRF
jgi:hypothetical protein